MLALALRVLLVAAPLATAAAFDPAELRAVPALTAPSAAEALEARWRRQVCTAPGCAGPASQPWVQAASFGAAVVAAGWIGRRRQTPGS